MEEKIERLAKWAIGEKAPPYTLELNITNKCNLKCRFCWLRDANVSFDELTDGDLLRIVDEAIELGVIEFRFPGSGEPMVRKKILFRLMKKIKNNKRTGLLITNGTLFNETDIKNLVKMEWDILTVSLHGPDPQTHDYLTQVKGSFKRVERTLELIRKWKKKMNSNNPWLRMNVVLTNKNYDKLEQIVEFASIFDFKEIILQPMTVFSKEGEKLIIDERRVSKYLKKADKKAKKLGVKTNMKTFVRNTMIEKTNEMEKMIKEEMKKFKGFLATPCYEPFYNFIIMPDGKAGPCAIAGGKTEASVKKSSLKDVWYGPYFENFRKRLLDKKLFPFCSHCCVPIFLENKRIRLELSKVLQK